MSTGERTHYSPNEGRYRYRPSSERLILGAVSAAIALLVLTPVVYLTARALSVGMADSVSILVSPRTTRVVANSIVLSVVVAVASFLIALPFAWFTVRTNMPWRRLWTVLGTMPLAIPSYVGAYALVAMMGPRGIVQGWLEPIGIERIPSIYGLFGSAWALTLFTYPFLFLSLRAGMLNLDPSLEEASRSLGVGRWHTFLRVTVPNLRPAISAGALLVALYVLSDFGAVSILRYNTFTRAIYLQYLSSFDRTYAALLSLVLVAIAVILLAAAQRIQGRQQVHRISVGVGRRSTPVLLGRWKALALLFCFGVVVASLILPASVIVYWLIRGLSAGESLLPAWTATMNSIQASLGAALAGAALAVPVAYYAVRFRSRFSSGIYKAVYLGNGLPGIVIALSLVFIGANYVPWLYQTIVMLLVAYVIRFLPAAAGTIRTGLMQISPRLEEASRSLGMTRSQTVLRVTLPILRPGILAAMALVFLSAMKELPATLLLGPTGYQTLATQIWSATEEAFFTRAAAPSLILLGVAALSVTLILRQESESRTR